MSASGTCAFATACPVAVVVVRKSRAPGYRNFSARQSGRAARVSPTETAWSQITGPSASPPTFTRPNPSRASRLHRYFPFASPCQRKYGSNSNASSVSNRL